MWENVGWQTCTGIMIQEKLCDQVSSSSDPTVPRSHMVYGLQPDRNKLPRFNMQRLGACNSVCEADLRKLVFPWQTKEHAQMIAHHLC